ncbi:MAG: class I SAM-dependent methyltransferase [Cytophagales bacterium]|nr:MAG: class I SAM-dependent methyltransferase [Cytophagales bacterium]
MKYQSINNCPICGSSKIKKWLEVKDWSISKETFEIHQCDDCGFKFTNPIPTIEQIGEYYKAEEYISHSDTKKGIINWLYHEIRRITIKSKLQLIKNCNTEKRNLLDIGCGTGYFLESAKKDNWNVEGFEPDDTARKLANQKLNNSIHQRLDDIKAEKFDIITLWHVLEHVHDIDYLFNFLIKKLKAKGKIIIAVPNIESWDAKYYQQYWAALDVPRHLYHFQKNNIELLSNKYQLKITKILPMYFDSFYVSMMSEKYKNPQQNNIVSSVKGALIGLISNILAIKKNNYSSLIYILSKNDE